MKFISLDELNGELLPFSDAVIVDNFIYVSGQQGIDPTTGEIISEDVEKQIYQTFENLIKVLEKCHSSLENVIKITVLVTDIDNLKIVNQYFRKYFKEHKPARTSYEVSHLPWNGLIEPLFELDAVAKLSKS